MSYLVYHIETTYILKGNDRREYYATEAAAKAALTRAVNGKQEHLGKRVTRKTHAVADVGIFRKGIEKQEIRNNLMSGKEFTQPVNTPLSCDPSSETYWSM